MRRLRRLAPSVRALFAHKVRTLLALTAIAAGVAAVLVTGAIGAGARREVLRETDAMGSDLLVVRPAEVKNSAARKGIRGVVTTLKLDDYRAIAELAQVREAVPGIERSLTVKAGGTAMSATVLGTTAAYLDVCRFRLRAGRFLDADDSRRAGRVAVLGARVDQNLFGGADPCGRDIRIGGIPFTVIGVLQAKGAQADGSDLDDRVLIPIRTALRRVFNATWLNPVFVSVRDPDNIDRAEREIAGLLRARHRLDDFSVQNRTRALAGQKQVAASLGALTTGLGAISMVIGGSGILALMLMSVKERTGEIGLRMAVGATAGDILAQFLTESILLAMGGSLAGLALGAAAALALAAGTTWKIAAPIEAIVASLAMAAVSGAGFGWYPAQKASRMPPIQALLVE